uniref:NACHT domain-containing protein n=1 Tax=Candidatus Kentrum eta TaxID=2126337 RepID=A0A450UDD9_9GAMM|nr:MAG: hypothetical protein BECKH772A_GA0070896_100117 [Candidatus Kentron sp. H]VFJ90344.1 MAG: hypothetical protein BECKH772B_GA0070898_100099 [Candidatus Kentron sp. H]VFJ97010.1 MAG: hypothetical protein BECKH772C_GA0070978_100107 [Candidatus Kentron sp. H]
MPTHPLHDPLTFWTLLGIFMAIALAIGRALVVWRKKKRYTREYFAVWGFGALLGLIGLFLAQLWLKLPLSAILIALVSPIARLFGLESLDTYQPPPLGNFATFITTLVLAGLALLYFRIHRDWRGAGGAISREQHQREEQQRESPGIVADMVTRARALGHPDLLEPYGSESDERLPLLEGAKDSRVWHEKARHLWLLRQRNYIFGEAFDEARRCWFGLEKNTGALVVLACHQGEDEARAARPGILDYLERVRRSPRDASGAPLQDQACFPFCRPLVGAADGGGWKIEFILAIQEGDTDRAETEDGVEYRTISESRLLDGLVDFSDYFQDIRYRVERETLPDSELTLRNTYTPSRYKLSKDDKLTSNNSKIFILAWLTEISLHKPALPGECGHDKTTATWFLIYRLLFGENEPVADNLEIFLHDWLAENSLRQVALLGEYGQGKTTAAWLLSYGLIQQYDQDKTRNRSGPPLFLPSMALDSGNPRRNDGAGVERLPRIPILLELRGKSPRSLTPEDLLATWAHRYGIDTRALLQLLIAGRVLLILEGFDEMDLTGDTETRISHFRTLWKLSYPKAKVLITGRPNFFLDDAERKSALGIQQPSAERPYCQAIHLVPFGTDQMKKSLRAADAGVRDGIVALAKKDERFREIVSRPSLLYIVSTLWQRKKLGQYRERISSALVMDLFIQHSYHRQGAKQEEHHYMALNTAERAYFMAGIAAYMGTRGLPNQISKQQLDEAIRGLIRAIPDGVSRSVTTMQNEVTLPLRSQTRYDWKTREAEIIEHIKTDARACGLLVSDLSKDGHFKFAHKSFMEFLEAKVFSQLFSTDEHERIAGKSIANTWKTEIDDLQNSPEAVAFLAELLEQRLHEQGYTEGSAIAKELLAVLVWRKLPGKLSWKGIFQRFLVMPALWLADLLTNIFDTRYREYVSISLLLIAIIVSGTGAFAVVVTDTFQFVLAAALVVPLALAFVVLSAVAIAVVSTLVSVFRETFLNVDAITLAGTLVLAGALVGGFAGIGIGEVVRLVTEQGFEWTMPLLLATLITGVGSLCGVWVGFCTDFLAKQKISIWQRLRLWYQVCKNLRLGSHYVMGNVVRLLEHRDSKRRG